MPLGSTDRDEEFTGLPGYRKEEPHGKAPQSQRRIQTSGREPLHRLAKRHDVSRKLIRIWVQKYEKGAFDDDVQAANLIQEYEARITAVERLVGKQALELEFLKGALKNVPRPKNGTTSVIASRHLPRAEGCRLM